jgi:hypothetical protein
MAGDTALSGARCNKMQLLLVLFEQSRAGICSNSFGTRTRLKRFKNKAIKMKRFKICGTLTPP